MTRFILVLLCIAAFLGCKNESTSDHNLAQYIPDNAPLIFIANNFDELKSSFQDNQIINRITNYQKFSSLDSLLNFNDFYYSGKSVLGLNTKDNGSLIYTLIVKSDSIVSISDSLNTYLSEDIIFKNKVIKKLSIHGDEIYSTKIKANSIYSNDIDEIKNILNGKISISNTRKFDKIQSTGNSIIIDSSIVNKFFRTDFFPGDSIISLKIVDKVIADYKITDEAVLINGVALKNTAQNALIDYFDETVAQENQIAKYIPENTIKATSFTFDDLITFQNNFASEKDTDSLPSKNVLNNITEIGEFRTELGHGVFMYSLNPSDDLENLLDISKSESYKNNQIFTIEESSRTFNFKPFMLNLEESIHVISLDNCFIFSLNKNFLKECIDSHLNKSTLSKLDAFIGIMENMSDESSIFLYYNAHGFNEFLNDGLEQELNLKLDKSKSYAIQFIVEKGFAHINAVLDKSGIKNSTQKITEQIQYNLNAEIEGQPQFLENHLANSMDIAMQDIDNNLIVTDSKGKLLFKKKLDGKILGEIEQLDTFKNGRRQLAFATSTSVYVVSRNGTDVGNFPRKFRDEITKPLSLFDYDNNRNYRLLVTQGSNLFMMDKNGKKVNGFKFQSKGGDINTQPKHFRIARKDYIVFSQGNRLRILSRVGKDRINISEKFNFSENEISAYQNKFTFSDADGNLIQVDQRGNVSKTKLSNSESHDFTTTSKTLVSLDDNILQIKSNKIELDFGNYTPPKIFYLDDKIYVSITDLQTNKILLFDSQGEPITGFPIYGSSSIDLANIDKDRNLEIVVKNGTDGIIVYQL